MQKWWFSIVMLVITRGYVLSLDPSILKAPFSAQGTRLPVDLVPKKGRDIFHVDRPNEKKQSLQLPSGSKRLMLRSAHQLICLMCFCRWNWWNMVELELLTASWQPLRGEPLRELQKTNRWIKTWVPMDQMDQRPWNKWCLFFWAGPLDHAFFGGHWFSQVWSLEPRIPKWYTAMWKLHICHETLLGSRDPQASTLW